MDDEFKRRIEAKLDKLDGQFDSTNERLSGLDKNLAVYNEQLKVHIEGTIQNREEIKVSRAYFDTELKPVKKHVVMVEGVLKFVGFIGLLVAIATGIAKLLGK